MLDHRTSTTELRQNSFDLTQDGSFKRLEEAFAPDNFDDPAKDTRTALLLRVIDRVDSQDSAFRAEVAGQLDNASLFDRVADSIKRPDQKDPFVRFEDIYECAPSAERKKIVAALEVLEHLGYVELNDRTVRRHPFLGVFPFPDSLNMNEVRLTEKGQAFLSSNETEQARVGPKTT